MALQGKVIGGVLTRRKLPQTPAPDDLTIEQRQAMKAWHRKRWPEAFCKPNGTEDEQALKRFLRRETDDCLIYHRKHGNQWADWYAAVQDWVRRTHDRDGFARKEPRSGSGPRKAFEKPLRPMQKPAVAQVLPLFREQG